MTLPNGEGGGAAPPSGPREPRLPLWFWGGLAAGLATLVFVAALAAAGLVRPGFTRLVTTPTAPALPASSPAPVAIRPPPTELPLLPIATPMLPSASTGTSAPSPQAPILPGSPSPVHGSVATRPLAPAAPTALRLVPGATPIIIPTLTPLPALATQPPLLIATATRTARPPAAPTRTPIASRLPAGPTVVLMTGQPSDTPVATATPMPAATLGASLPSPSPLPPTLAAPTTFPPTAVPPTALPPTPVPPAIPPGLLPAAALVEIIQVPANIQDAAALTATVKYMTDTVAGPHSGTIALMTSGLPNVPISVPVRLQARPADPRAPGVKVAWQLTAPPGSRAALLDREHGQATFVPDLPGFYRAEAGLLNAEGQMGPLGSLQLYAGTYAGLDAGRCAACHPQQAAAWAKTGHATLFKDQLDNARTPAVPTRYAELCIGCHTTGYYPPPYNGAGGFPDAQAGTHWQFPTFAAIDAAARGGGPSNWANLPPALKNVANVQCEVCHGPAGAHAQGQRGPGGLMTSWAEGVCNQCHNGGGPYLQGTELQSAGHSDPHAAAWTVPTGPGHQECVRCHSGRGYASFLADPQNMAAWDNTPQPVVCSTCHDPHAAGRPWQLRVSGVPVGLPFEAGDVGLSATCYECHNARTNPEAAPPPASAVPHYSSAAEFIGDTGGVTYGKAIPNSPHGTTVGRGPVPNPAYKEGSGEPKFLFSPAGDAGGQTPGACVACHMWPTIQDPQDPNSHKVGAHALKMVAPDGKSDYVAACQGCHAALQNFNLKAGADYDGNGKVEGVQDEVAGLLHIVWGALEAQGVTRVVGGYPYATLPAAGAGGGIDPKIQNTWYNYRSVYGTLWGPNGPGDNGKAQAIHNFKRAVGLLQASYKDLTGRDVPGAEILVK